MAAEKKTIRIIVAAHKPYQMPEDPMYLPLQVGAKGRESIGYQRDDEGENISELNPYFCELTGLYWAWKNLNADYLGLVHYRRHFSFYPKPSDLWESVLTKKEIEPYLLKTKIFVPAKRKYYIETLYSHYAHTHFAVQLDTAREIIRQKYPNDLPACDKIFRRCWGYMFNMMIAEQELFSEYCTWLFDILFELRKKLSEEEKKLDAYQARFYGRISEILLNVWLESKLQTGRIQKEEIQEIPFIYMEKVNWKKKGTAFLKAKFAGKRYQGSF